jgi:hypothetical protein
MDTLNKSLTTPVLPLTIGKIILDKPQNASSTLAFARVYFEVAGFAFSLSNIQIRYGTGREVYGLLPQHPVKLKNEDRLWRKTAVVDVRLWTPILAAIIAQYKAEEAANSPVVQSSQPLTPDFGRSL